MDDDGVGVGKGVVLWLKMALVTFKLRTFAHAFTPPLNPLPIAWRGDFKMRFSPPLQYLEREPGGEVSESPETFRLINHKLKRITSYDR